jgi:DamX protein
MKTELALMEKPLDVANKPEAPQPILSTSAVVSAPEKESKAKRKILRENWLLAQDSSYYTIQIMGVQNEQYILSFVDDHELPADREIAYYQTRYRGKKWYFLLYGVYATQKEAGAAVKELPAEIQQASPWVRKMSAVQNAIRRAPKIKPAQ